MIVELARRTISKLRQTAGELTLVVDDGPSQSTPLLLSLLEQAGHRAVLFVVGSNIGGREEMLVEALQRGFALGNHSEGHERFSTLTLTEARSSILRTEERIHSLYARAGVVRQGLWFRFPYLDTGGERAPALQDLLAQLGFERPASIGRRITAEERKRLDWPSTVFTRDWALPPESELRASLQAARPGDIVEMHDKPEAVERYGRALIDELSKLALRASLPRTHGGTSKGVRTKW